MHAWNSPGMLFIGNSVVPADAVILQPDRLRALKHSMIKI